MSAPSFTDLPVLRNSPADSARREAVRLFTSGYLASGSQADLGDWHGDFDQTCAGVRDGAAPQEFKDVFFATLDRLIAAVR